MRNILFIRNLCILLSLGFLGCVEKNAQSSTEYEIPTMGHDLGYIPYDVKLDKSDYVVCDSTGILSGRNRLQYAGGGLKLRDDIIAKFGDHPEYEFFNGYVVVRFLFNCEGKTGRYRAQALNLDFSPAEAPSDLLTYSKDLIKSVDSWTRRPGSDAKAEYSKFINLKINKGKIEHVLL